MVFSLEHDIKVTKSHQNLLPTQSVIVVHTVLLRMIPKYVCKSMWKSNFMENSIS
jgi:hypothetical protein